MRRLAFLFFPLLFLLISGLDLIPVADIRQSSGILGLNGKPLGELAVGTEFKQSFTPRQRIVAGVAVNFATYFRVNKGTVYLTLSTIRQNALGKKDVIIPEKQLVQAKVSASKLREKDYIFWFSPRRVTPGRPLLLTLTSDSWSGQAITVWASKEDVYRGGRLFVNEDEVKGDMVFQAYYFESLAGILGRMVRGETTYKPLVNPYLALVVTLTFLALVGLCLETIMRKQF